MTAREKALWLCYQAGRRICVLGGERPNPNDDRPATRLIADCFWSEAVAEITEAINDLQQAKAALAPLAENRARPTD